MSSDYFTPEEIEDNWNSIIDEIENEKKVKGIYTIFMKINDSNFKKDNPNNVEEFSNNKFSNKIIFKLDLKRQYKRKKNIATFNVTKETSFYDLKGRMIECGFIIKKEYNLMTKFNQYNNKNTIYMKGGFSGIKIEDCPIEYLGLTENAIFEIINL